MYFSIYFSNTENVKIKIITDMIIYGYKVCLFVEYKYKLWA